MTRINFAALSGGLMMLAQAAFAAEVQVTIDNFSFTPAQITVAPGTRVVWTNRDDMPHTVTDAVNPSGIKSPPLDTDDHYERVFDKPGTYEYFCSLHPHMTGNVIVR